MGDNDVNTTLRIDGNSAGGQQAVDGVVDRLKALSDQAKQTGQEASQAHDNAAQSAVKLGDALKDAYESPQAALKSLVTGVDEGLVSALGGVAAGAAVASVALLAMLTDSAVKALELGEALQDVAYKLDTSASNAAALKYAFDIAGGSIDQASNLLFMMQQRMENDTSGKFAAGLKNIGLSVQDIQGMDPVDMFLKIAEAFRDNTDSSDRAATAMDLFGRQGRDAVSIMMKPLSELNDEFKKSGDYQDANAEAAERVGMAWRKLKEDVSWLETDLGLRFLDALSLQFTGNTFNSLFAGPTGEQLDSMKPGFLAGTTLGQFGEAVSGQEGNALGQLAIAPNPTGLSLSKAALKETIDDYKLQLDQKIAKEKEDKAALEALTKAQNEWAKAFDAANEAGHKATIDAMAAIGKADAGAIWGVKGQNTLMDMAVESGQVPYGVDASGNPLYANPLTTGASLIQGPLGSSPFNIGNIGLENPSSAARVGSAGSSPYASLFSKGIPDAITRSLEGGGNVFASVGSVVGQSLAQQTTASFTKELTGSSGIASGLDKTIGSIGGGLVGAGIGLLGKAIGSLFGGPSQDELASRSSRDQFMAPFQSATDATGIQSLANALTQAGMSADIARGKIAAMLDAKNPQAFQAALKPILSELQLGTDAQTALNDALSRYKFTEEQLGPALQRQNLDQQAQQLYKDWSVLTAAQISSRDVLTQMSGNLNQFVADSRHAGVEVPAAMEPMIEQAIKFGLITDDNGNVITDLKDSGITFSQTMTQGFQSVVSAVKDLSNAIKASLGIALDDVTSSANSAAAAIDNLNHTQVQPGGMPGISEDGMTPSFPTEAYVRYPTLATIGDVAGGEFVLKPSTIARYMNAATAAGAAVGGSGVTVHVDASGSMFTDQSSMQKLARVVGDAMQSRVRNNAQLSLRR